LLTVVRGLVLARLPNARGTIEKKRAIPRAAKSMGVLSLPLERQRATMTPLATRKMRRRAQRMAEGTTDSG